MTTVRFQQRGHSYAVRFAYDPAIVEAIKTVVPADYRVWNKASKEWTVDLDFGRHLADMLKLSGHTVVGLDHASAGVDWAQGLLAAVGPERVDATYRALSRVLHPDTDTGDAVLQRQLNAARNELR